MLMQKGKVVKYASRQLKSHKKNYPTHDLELAAMILEEQLKDAKCDKYKRQMASGDTTNFTLGKDGELRFMSKMYVSEGSIKMYRDIRSLYWWPEMKNEISEYVSSCLSCQQEKVEHQVPSGKLYPLEIPKWKWFNITMNLFFLCQIGSKVHIEVLETTAAQDQKNAYTDKKRNDISFEIGDKVFFKVSPWKKVIRFGLKGKFSPHFRGPYEVLERIGPVAYRLTLPSKSSKIHNMFHVSTLRRYRSNPDHVVQVEALEVEPNLSYEEEYVCILAREVKELRNKRIPLVKVLWKNHNTKEAT
ncbi:pol protein [Gossypium australe]|uniref:Pol protein n=1 Tax=Gossypium australe TaxID=47621 RepID=A0A5B6WNS3_9ROSI|nr:pol protein [Gossypium australe]